MRLAKGVAQSGATIVATTLASDKCRVQPASSRVCRMEARVAMR